MAGGTEASEQTAGGMPAAAASRGACGEPSCSGRSADDARAATRPGADELRRALLRAYSGAVRGAVIGLTLRGGLHLAGFAISALTSSGGKGARGRQKRAVGAAEAARDSLRYAAFLASLAATYIGVEEGIARVFGKARSSKWRALVAGACAGQTLLLTGRNERHYSLAVYILLRGLTLLVRTGNRPSSPPLLRALLAPTRMEHGDTLLMCACCSQIIYSFIMHPSTLPPSYVRFIRKQGAKELYVYEGIRELASRTAAGLPLYPLAALQGTPYAHVHGSVPCRFFHPGQSCGGHAASILPRNFQRALRVYLPVYLIPALLVHRRGLLEDPAPILRKAAVGVARSSLFLSLCICMAFGGACAGHRVLGHTGPSVLALSTWVGGLALLVEKKSRRMELALYVLSRSLESFSRCMVEWGWVRPRAFPARLDVLLFAAGCGAIMHCYSDGNGRYRGCFRSKYLNLLDFVFGAEGIQEGSITHVPSNEALIHQVGMRVSRSFRSLSAANLLALSARHGGSRDDLQRAARGASPAPRAAAAAGAGAAAAAGASPAAGGGGPLRSLAASRLSRGSWREGAAGGEDAALSSPSSDGGQAAPGAAAAGSGRVGGGETPPVSPPSLQAAPLPRAHQQQQQQQQQQQSPGCCSPTSGRPPMSPPQQSRQRSFSADDTAGLAN